MTQPTNYVPVKKIIRVSPKRIQDNADHLKNNQPERCLPAIVVEIERPGQTNQFIYCWKCDIQGPSRVVHNDEKPLISGTRVWVETEAYCELLLDRPT